MKAYRYVKTVLVFALVLLFPTMIASAEDEIDLSGVSLRVAGADWHNAQGPIEAAGLTDYAYKVEFSVMQGGNLVMEALAAGQIDLGTGSQIPPIAASQAANGGNFKIIAIRRMNTLNQELIAGPGKTYASAADLKGAKVGYVKNTTAHYFLYKMLAQAGLSWTDIEAVPLTTADGLTALLSGDIDAFASYGNTVRTAKANGATTIQSATGILSGDYYFYATPAAISDEATHAAIADYLRRYNDALEWCRQNPEAYAEWLADATNQDYDTVYDNFVSGEAQTKTCVLPVDDATIASEQDIVDVFTALGLIEGSVDIPALYDHSFGDAISAYPQY